MLENDGRRGPGTGENGSFEELLDEGYKAPSRLEPGQKVSAPVVKVTAEWVFLDLGRKEEGIVDRKELADPEGRVAIREGDLLEAYFIAPAGNELRLTTRIGGGAAGAAQLEEAWRSGIPVEGLVAREVKGGYEVTLGGAFRAFCPHSQMELPRARSVDVPIGRRFTFRITEFRDRGRSLVLSRRAILEEEARAERDALKRTLREGMTLRGTVSSVRDFGAFVRAGGIEGLVPVSEIGWERVADARDALAAGQEVEVVLTRLDWEKERFAFTMKKAADDPWEGVESRFPAGSTHTGQVTRLSPFGAFVSLGPGIEGLVHVSKLGRGKRIRHPGDALREGEPLTVRVESVDRVRRRLSLVPAREGGGEGAEASGEELAKYSEERPREIGALGEALRASLARRKPKGKGP